MINVNAAEAGRGANWLLEGFDYFKRSAGPWIGNAILLFIMAIVASFIPLLGNLVFQLLVPVFLAGLILGCRAQDNGQSLTLGHLFAGFSTHTGQLILVGALYFAGLLLLVFLTAILGFLLLGNLMFLQEIAAGEDMTLLAEHALSISLVMLIAMALYVPLLMAFWFAPALVVLEGQGAVEAMVLSFRGCLRNIVPFLVYGLVGLVLSIVASLPFMLGWLILFPMLVASMYIAYKDIFTGPVVELA